MSSEQSTQADHHQSRERLAFALREMGIGFWLNALPLGSLNWDDRTRELFFLPPGVEPSIEWFWNAIHPDDRESTRLAVEKAIRDHTPYAIDHRVINPATGEIRWIRSMGQASYSADGTPAAFDGINYDITDRKHVEEKLRQAHAELDRKVQERTAELTQVNARLQESLDEKEVLLKEIHHRVKNNLQVISSLLDLQSRYTKDASAIEMFRESQRRVLSMGLVHERLYRSGDLAKVDFKEYLVSLADHLVQSYRVNTAAVRIEVDAGQTAGDAEGQIIQLPIDVALPCGLLVNELISNSLKHAFKGREKGNIRINLHPVDEGQAKLVVTDDGVGLPAGFDLERPATFGLKLVVLLTAQLQGKIEIDRASGTAFRITFPIAKPIYRRK